MCRVRRRKLRAEWSAVAAASRGSCVLQTRGPSGALSCRSHPGSDGDVQYEPIVRNVHHKLRHKEGSRRTPLPARLPTSSREPMRRIDGPLEARTPGRQCRTRQSRLSCSADALGSKRLYLLPLPPTPAPHRCLRLAPGLCSRAQTHHARGHKEAGTSVYARTVRTVPPSWAKSVAALGACTCTHV